MMGKVDDEHNRTGENPGFRDAQVKCRWSTAATSGTVTTRCLRARGLTALLAIWIELR